MHSVLFSIGSFTAYSYGLCIALAMTAAIGISMVRSKKYGIDPDMIFSAGIYAVLGGIIGAKLLFIIVEIKSIIADPSILLNFGSGFVIYGGIIAGVATYCLYISKVRKTTLIDKIDLAAPSVPLAQAIGRIGCFMAGCCYGKEVAEGTWYAVVFPVSSQAPAGIPLIPTQLISSAGDLLIAAFLYWYSKKQKFGGEGLCLYMGLYAIGRFFIEFLRDDPRGSVGFLSTSQFISIMILIAAVGLYILLKFADFRPMTEGGYPVEEEEDEEESEDEETEETAEEVAEAATEETETAEAEETEDSEEKEALPEKAEE